MLIGLLTTVLILDGLFMILLILIQKGKGSMGLGALGGGAQTIFGGSGGQDLFQKMTWVTGSIFMAGSLGLAILKSHGTHMSNYIGTRPSLPIRARSVSTDQSTQPTKPTTEPVTASPETTAKPEATGETRP